MTTAQQAAERIKLALRPIDDDGQTHGGPDGWHPSDDEISEWEKSFREAANPSALRALLAERDELAKDAARYRLLRANHWSQGDGTLVVVRAKSLRLGVITYSGHLLDEAVDPALINKD